MPSRQLARLASLPRCFCVPRKAAVLVSGQILLSSHAARSATIRRYRTPNQLNWLVNVAVSGEVLRIGQVNLHADDFPAVSV